MKRKMKKASKEKYKTSDELPLSQVKNGLTSPYQESSSSSSQSSRDPSQRIIQGPYRILMEQLEAFDLSDIDPGWVPPEASAIQCESWRQKRDQLRESVRVRFNEMRWTSFNDACGFNDEERAPSRSSNNENPETEPNQKPETVPKKPSGSYHKTGVSKGNRAICQYNRNYKGKNRWVIDKKQIIKII